MTLEKALEAQLQSVVITSRFGDAREVVDVAPLRVVRDAPGRKRDPRRETIIITGIDPIVALRTVKEYKPKHWVLSVVEPTGTDHDALKAAYKANGYRLLIRFPFFAFDLSRKLPKFEGAALRAVMEGKAPVISMKNYRLAPGNKELEKSDELIRMYACFGGKTPIGWVQSIRSNECATWVSNLYVMEEHRGKGLGSELMAKMLHDDLRFGAKYSYLLASNEGSRLYRRLGYDEIGLMQIFTPVRQAKVTPNDRR